MKITVGDVLQIAYYCRDVKVKIRHDETMLLYGPGNFVYNT